MPFTTKSAEHLVKIPDIPSIHSSYLKPDNAFNHFVWRNYVGSSRAASKCSFDPGAPLICANRSMVYACALVKYFLDEEPVSDKLFVFCNRSRDKIKILQWSTNGFWLHYKRLEKGRFKWPELDDEQVSQMIGRRELNWLLDGLPLVQPKAHKQVNFIYF